MEVKSWNRWMTAILLVTNFYGCLCWPTLQPPLGPVTSKHELDSDESRKVLGSSVVTSVSVIMDHGNGTKTFLSDGMENPELKSNIIGSPGNLLSPDKYEFYTFDETGDLVKRLMTWDEIQGLIAGGEGEGILGEASMPMYYSDILPDKMGTTHLTANDFQTSDIQGVHKVVESVQNVLKGELAAAQSKLPPVAKPPFISNAPNWSLFLPSILDNAEDGSELNNLPGMLVSPAAHYTSIAIGSETTPSSAASASVTEIMLANTKNSSKMPTTNVLAEITTTPFKEYTKKPEKPIRHKTTTSKPIFPVKSTFSPPAKISNRPAADNLVSTTTNPSTPFKKYSTTKYGDFSNSDRWFSTSTASPSTSKKNDYWYSTSNPLPSSSKRTDFWHSSTRTEPTTKRTENWYSTTTAAASTPPKKTFTSSKYGGYLSHDEVKPTSSPFNIRKTSTVSSKFGDPSTSNEYGTSIESTTSRKTLTTSKYGGYTTHNELFASIASVLHQVTDDVKPTGAVTSSATSTFYSKPTSTTQYKVSTEANRFSTSNKFQYKPSSIGGNMQSVQMENKTQFNNQNYITDSMKYTTLADIFKTSNKYTQDPSRFTVTSSEGYRPSSQSSQKPFIDNKFADKNNNFQHKFSTESYVALENRKTLPPFSKFTSTSIPNKYFISDSEKHGSTHAQKVSTEPTKYSSPTSFKTSSTSQSTTDSATADSSLTASSFSASSSETSPDAETPTGFSNYVSLSTSSLQQTDATFKPTKTYTSSTSSPMAHVPLLKQPLTMKPVKPTKSSITKGTSRLPAYTPSVSVTPRPQSTATTSITTEKPLVRISTLGSTITDATTMHPETLVTWISTFPLEETPSKVALNGVFDSDKLVTEQYVSSHHNRHPVIEEFFKNLTTAAAAAKESTTAEPSTTDNHSATVASVTSSLNKLYSTTLPHSSHSSSSSSSGSSSSSYNHSPTAALLSIFESSRPFRTSERPFYWVESKTEPINASTHTHRYPTSSHQTIHTVPTEYTEIKVLRTTTTTTTGKPATSPAATTNHSSAETVMQRVPTINPPNKVHTNSSSSSSVQKSSTKPQYLSTEATKNVTQIAVMVNKSNETRIELQQRNKVTSRPTFETTKPIDCVTTSSSNHSSQSTSSSTITSYTSSSPVASSQKENSHIYYYKLPAITSSPLHDLHVYHHRATSTSTTTDATLSTQHIRAEPSSMVTTEKEYQKITTVNHPSSSELVQNGISAVTNILLQTEGRVPNKEFVESEGGVTGTVSTSSNSISSSIGSAIPSHSTTTEQILRTEQLQSQTRSATTNASRADLISLATTPITRLENQTATPLVRTTTSPVIKYSEVPLLTTASKPFNNTHIGSSTTVISTTKTMATARTPTTTNSPTTTEVISSTDISSELTTNLPPTTISSDFRNDFGSDVRNITREEDDKNYHSNNLSAIRSGNVIKNVTSTTVTASKPTTSSTKSTTTEEPRVRVTPTTAKVTTTVDVAKSSTTLQRSSSTTTYTPTTSPSTTTVPSTTAYTATKINTTTKTDIKSDISSNEAPPPSSFRSPPSPAPKVPTVSSTTGAAVELHPAPHESMGLEASVAYLGDDVKRFIDFCNELSFKIWTSQTGKSLVTSRSIVLSPFSVLSTLTMIFLGARGSSSGIMNDFLRLDDMVTFNPHQVLQNITESVVNTKNIGVANAAFVREVFSDKAKGKVLDFYKERLQQYYDTHVEEINFNIIGDLVRRRTNLLVKRQTQGKIQDYLRGSALILKPPLAVLTANIFQTDCDAASTEGRDGEMYFVVRPSTRQRRLVPIPAVVYRTGFLAGYEPGLDATAVTLNTESTVSTILVLPGQQGQVAPGDGLARLEQRLLESSYRRGAWSRLLRSLLFRPSLELQIPRFSHKSVLNLTAGLQKMGMADIFAADKADLRGINGVSNELHLSDLVQVNTFSTCGEETVDARHHIETYPLSPQRVGRSRDIFDHTFLDNSVNNYYSSLPLNLRPRQARLPDNPRLRFDRPFLYIVRHNPTGLILYIGRFNPRLLP